MISRLFKSDYTFSETDSYTIVIVQHPELKCDATQVEIDDTRYLSCLSVVPLVMDATSIKPFYTALSFVPGFTFLSRSDKDPT